MEREDAAALRGQVQTYNQSLHAAQEEANAAAEAVAGSSGRSCKARSIGRRKALRA